MLHHFIVQKIYIINKEIPVDRLIERRNGAVTFSKSELPTNVESKNKLSLLGLGVSDGVKKVVSSLLYIDGCLAIQKATPKLHH